MGTGTKWEPGSAVDPEDPTLTLSGLRAGCSDREKSLCLQVHCPGMAFDLPARWISRKINAMEFSALHSHNHLKLQRKENSSWDTGGERGFYCNRAEIPSRL